GLLFRVERRVYGKRTPSKMRRGNRSTSLLKILIPLLIAAFVSSLVAAEKRLVAPTGAPPETFPRFIVPGHEAQMETLRELYYLHYKGNGPMATLWDEWLPQATLWPAVGSGAQLDEMTQRWASALSGRHIDGEGYVSTHQHDGLGHAEGWPFPLWQQGKG